MPTQKYVKDARLNCTVIQAISSTLNTLQKRSGCSQEKFARLIGVTPLTYRRLLAGKANPMILLLYSISCRLHIELEQLLGFRPLDTVELAGIERGGNAPSQVTQESRGAPEVTDGGGFSSRRTIRKRRDRNGPSAAPNRGRV